MSTAPPVLSLAQQRAALWPHESSVVYAVILGPRLKDLRERLAKAEIDEWDILWTGELEPDEQRQAPHLVKLSREGPFTDWLLGQAAEEFGDWGVLVCGRLSFLALRSHGRALCQAQLPDGASLRLDWADPVILDKLLAFASRNQVSQALGPLEAIVAPGATQWIRWSQSAGQLQRAVTGVQPQS